MRISRLLPVVLVAALTLAGRADAQFRATEPTPGEEFHVELAVMFWTPTPEILIATGGGATGAVDFVQEFGIANKRVTEFRGVLKGGKHKLRVSKVPVAYEESVRLAHAVTFGGRTFGAGTEAATRLTWDLWRVGYEYDFVARSRGLAGFILDVKQNRVTADIRASSALGTVQSLSDVKAPIPTLGFLVRVYPHRTVSLTAEYTGFKMPGFLRNRLPDDLKADGTFTDFDVSAVLSVTRYLGVQGGYRSVATDYTVDDDSGDLAIKGPYFGGIVRF
jgi:hypothetical protein